MRYSVHVTTDVVVTDHKTRKPRNHVAKIGQVSCESKEYATDLAEHLSHFDNEKMQAHPVVEFYGPNGKVTLSFGQIDALLEEWTTGSRSKAA